MTLVAEAEPAGPAATSVPGTHDPSTERRQYTIKGVDSKVIEQMRAAARAEGMKVNAWISSLIQQAAERHQTDHQDQERSWILSEIHSLRQNVSCVETAQKETKIAIDELRSAIQRVIDAQHGVLTLMARISEK